MIFVEKNYKQNFGDLAKNCPLNPMSLPPPPRISKFFRLTPPAAKGFGEPCLLLSNEFYMDIELLKRNCPKF
jgi:hypothetical protein